MNWNVIWVTSQQRAMGGESACTWSLEEYMGCPLKDEYTLYMYIVYARKPSDMKVNHLCSEQKIIVGVCPPLLALHFSRGWVGDQLNGR